MLPMENMLEHFQILAGINPAAVADKISGVNKRVYYCQRCLNHGLLEPRKNHKCECAYAHCSCSKCILVEKRRVLNTQLHELEDIQEPVEPESSTAATAVDEPTHSQLAGGLDSLDFGLGTGGRIKGEPLE